MPNAAIIGHMRYLVFATDYDGTLAHHGTVEPAVIEALERCRTSGRRLVMVTGREMKDLSQIFTRFDLFDYVVAENGGTLYRPETREEIPIAERPPPEFLHELRLRGVGPISVGNVIVATWEPHETTVLTTIRDLGLELQVIFNKGAVMVLPSGVNKSTGLAAALARMRLSAHNVVAIGDAENDHALLSSVEVGVAVANAVPTLAERADLVTTQPNGRGVMELIDRLVTNDLADLGPQLLRHHLLLGRDAAGQEVRIPSFGTNVLIAGPSDSGRPALAAAFLEQLVERKLQFCVIDPNGDYAAFPNVAVEGSRKQPPEFDRIMTLLEEPQQNVVANLHAVPAADRPLMFTALLNLLQELRIRTGHPHWIVVDEAHQVLPSNAVATSVPVPPLDRVLFTTLAEFDREMSPALAAVDHLVAFGNDVSATFERFGRAAGIRIPKLPATARSDAQAIFWSKSPEQAIVITPAEETIEHRRRSRAYVDGDVGSEHSFYFRGAAGKLNLQAQNLVTFLQIAAGVDDETWLHHLHQGDYSRWFRETTHDPHLERAAAEVESEPDISAAESRAAIKSLIEDKYTLPGRLATPVKQPEQPFLPNAAE